MPSLRIEIRVDPASLRLWQRHLVDRLRAKPGLTLRIVASPQREAWPRGFATLLALEGVIGGGSGGAAWEPVAPDDLDLSGSDEGAADLVIDLAGDAAAADSPVLDLVCDGRSLEAGAIAAVLDRRVPGFETRLTHSDGSAILSRWRPAVETPHHAGSALSMLLGRAAEMLEFEVDRFAAGQTTAIDPDRGGSQRGGSPAGFFLHSLETRISTRLLRLLDRAPDWHVALRPRRNGAGLPDLDGAGFRRLADDSHRFYADPFLFEHGGETFLFVEEFPYATGRGIISLARIAGDGSVSTPEPVLEGPDHLSYPFVFESAGQIWMIPETSARRTVELYRADPFPERWVLDRILIEDADLADVTLLEQDGGWWIFAAERKRWTSSWDALSLYRAPSLHGPWRPHPGNPVLVDRRAARPGGRILNVDGRLVRPAQDCEGGYGAALAFAAIDRLDEGGFHQSVLARAAPFGRNSGLHSYDRSARFEAIDLFGPR